MDHKKLAQVIIAGTLTAVFVFTAVITSLSLLGWVKFVDHDQQAKLFYVLIVDVITAGVVYFSGLLNSRTPAIRQEYQSDTMIPKSDKPEPTISQCFALPYFQTRGVVLKDLLDVIKGSQDVVLVNGLSRKYLYDPSFLDEFRKTLKSIKHLTIIWDSKYNQSIRFFQMKQWDKALKEYDLTAHLYEKVDDPLRKFVKLRESFPSLEAKMLSFPISYTLLRFDKGIYVTFLGVVRGSDCPCIFVERENKLWYDHFNNLIEHMITVASDIHYTPPDSVKTSELLQIVNEKGELLTALPRKYIEFINRKDNSVQRKNLGHRHVYCFVMSTAGRLLLQKRAKGKDNEQLWDKSVGGHVQFDETVVGACIREAEEELGLIYDNDRHFLSVIKTQDCPRELRRIVMKDNEAINLVEYSSYELFLLEQVAEQEIKPNPAEVQDITWMTTKAALEFIRSKPSEVTPDLIDLQPQIEKLSSRTRNCV